MKTMRSTLPSPRKLVLVLASLLIAGTTASAQTVYGSIVGTVADATGSGVPSASVMLTNLGTNEARTAQTDTNGNYTFVNLLPGNYAITIEKAGFKKLVRQPIEIQVNSAIRIDLPIEVGDSMQTVQVTGESPLVQTQNATIGTEVEARQVADLALNGRNVLNLIELAGSGPTGQHVERRKCRYRRSYNAQLSDGRRTGGSERRLRRWRACQCLLREWCSLGAGPGRSAGVSNCYQRRGPGVWAVRGRRRQYQHQIRH